MLKTNRIIQHLEMELEDLYECIAGSNPDTDWYEGICIKIADKNAELAEARMKIGDLKWSS